MGIFLKRNIGENAIVGLWEITETVDDLFSNVSLMMKKKNCIKVLE